MKNKGFTLVELLVTIVIIGLLASIGLVGFGSVFDRAEENYYQVMEDNVLMSANDFFQDHRDMLPLSDYNEVPINELILGKYLEPLKDRQGNLCSGGTVFIYRNSDGTYKYEVCLKCGNYESSGALCESGGKPSVIVDGKTKVSEDPYPGSCNYITETDNESVTMMFNTRRDVKKYIIKNLDDNSTRVCNPEDSRHCELDFDSSGNYQIIGYDNDDNVVTKESNFCIRIKRYAPEFNIVARGLEIIENNGETKSITFKIDNISDSVVKREYRISSNSTEGNYQTFTGDTFSATLGSNHDYYLEVRLTNSYGLETEKSFSFDVGYLVSLDYGAGNVQKNLVVVRGLEYGAMDEKIVNYPQYSTLIGKLPDKYNGVVATWLDGDEDEVTNESIVEKTKTHTLTLQVEKVPKDNSYCEDLTYTGEEQTLAYDTGKIKFTNTTATAAGSHPVTATLVEGNIWDDNTTAPYTMYCDIKPLSLEDGGSVENLVDKVYTGSAITQNPTVKFYEETLTLNKDYTVAITNNINVGTALVTVTGKGNYKGLITGEFDITEATITIPSSPADREATGSSISHGVTIPAHTSIVSTGSVTSAKNVGNYKIILKLDDSNNYMWSDGTKGNKEIPWKLISPGQASITCKTVTYTGSAQVIATCKNGTINADATKTNAGTYTVTCTPATNYTAAEPKSCTIAKADPTCPTLKAYSGTYNGSSHTITVTGGSGGTIQYQKVVDGTSSSWSTTLQTRISAGTTKINVKVVGDSNHNNKSCGSANIVINKKAITCKADNKKFTYGGTVPTYTYTITGAVSGETAVSGTATYKVYNSDNKAVTIKSTSTPGTYTIKVSGLSAKSNYSMSSCTEGTLTINKQTNTLTFSANSFKFDEDGTTVMRNGKGDASKAKTCKLNPGDTVCNITSPAVDQDEVGYWVKTADSKTKAYASGAKIKVGKSADSANSVIKTGTTFYAYMPPLRCCFVNLADSELSSDGKFTDPKGTHPERKNCYYRVARKTNPCSDSKEDQPNGKWEKNHVYYRSVADPWGCTCYHQGYTWISQSIAQTNCKNDYNCDAAQYKFGANSRKMYTISTTKDLSKGCSSGGTLAGSVTGHYVCELRKYVCSNKSCPA